MVTMWGDCPKAELMAVWCSALGAIEPERIRVALEKVSTSYPEWPPTLGEFLLLCKPSIPAAHRLLIPDRSPREPIPQHIRDVMRKVREQAKQQ